MTQAAQQQPISNASDATRAIESLNAIMDSLVRTVEEETAYVSAGKLSAAVLFDETKAELARRYAAEAERLRAAKTLVGRSLPAELETLRARHEAFQALLRKNLTVLATAHAVGEGIIRGVAGELNRKHAPSTYGASGRTNAPSPRTSQPMAVSKSL
jgi:hypothetical protein